LYVAGGSSVDDVSKYGKAVGRPFTHTGLHCGNIDSAADIDNTDFSGMQLELPVVSKLTPLTKQNVNKIQCIHMLMATCSDLGFGRVLRKPQKSQTAQLLL